MKFLDKTFFYKKGSEKIGLVNPLSTYNSLYVLGIIRGTYIKHYEPVWYDTIALRRHRERVRRDATDAIKDQPLILHVRILDR